MNTALSYDIIIIGAGSIGTPAAFYLAEKKMKVLVVETLPSPGQGANKAAIGGVRATHSDPAKIQLGLRSLEIFSTWKQRYGQDIEWHQGGYSFLAYGEREERLLKDLLKIQKSYGLNIDWLDTAGVVDLIPGVNQVNLLGGTYSPGDGYCSNLRANHAFYVQAQVSGADFHFNETVQAIHTQGNRVTGVRTDRGSYNASIVLNAAGPYAAQVGAMVGLEHRVQPDSHEAGITEPVARFLEPLIVDIRPQPGSANIYFYQQETGQFNLCLTPDPPIFGYDLDETSQFLPQISRRVIDVLPKMANIRVRRTWRGLYPMTPDGFPIVGSIDGLEGYLVAIGMCGQGFMLGPAIGEFLSRWITQTEISPEDRVILEALDPQRDFVGKETLK
jgi:sarcosine oxidase subunit beta